MCNYIYGKLSTSNAAQKGNIQDICADNAGGFFVVGLA